MSKTGHSSDATGPSWPMAGENGPWVLGAPTIVLRKVGGLPQAVLQNQHFSKSRLDRGRKPFLHFTQEAVLKYSRYTEPLTYGK